MFRHKQMSLADWHAFQASFEATFINVFHGDARAALFTEWGNNREPFTMLIPDWNHEVFEALSPGGWEDATDTGDKRWMLLVGHDGAHEFFHLQKPPAARG